jgi:hypothetical protein
MYRVLDATSAARHNPALNLAVDVGNEVERPVVVFFAPVPFYLHPTCGITDFSRRAYPILLRNWRGGVSALCCVHFPNTVW